MRAGSCARIPLNRRLSEPDHEGLAIEGDLVPGPELLALLRLDGVIQQHPAGADGRLGLAARGGQPAKFQELAKLDRFLADRHGARNRWFVLTHFVAIESGQLGLDRKSKRLNSSHA